MPLDDNREIQICADCKTAACWLGEFMCDTARTANLITTTVAAHRATNPDEHEYWYTAGYDKAVGR